MAELLKSDFIAMLVHQKRAIAERNGTYQPVTIPGRTVQEPKLHPTEAIGLAQYWLGIGAELEETIAGRVGHDKYLAAVSQAQSRIMETFASVYADALIISFESELFNTVKGCIQDGPREPMPSFRGSTIPMHDPGCVQAVYNAIGADGFIPAKQATILYFWIGAIARASSTYAWTAENIETAHERRMEALGPLRWIVEGWELVFRTVGSAVRRPSRLFKKLLVAGGLVAGGVVVWKLATSESESSTNGLTALSGPMSRDAFARKYPEKDFFVIFEDDGDVDRALIWDSQEDQASGKPPIKTVTVEAE